MKIKCLLISLSAAWLSACDPGLPDQGAAGGDDLSVKGYAEPLSYSEFEGMAPLRQYQVANKLLATLYKGMPVDEFFDITAALGSPTAQYNGNLLRDLQVRLGTELASAERKRIDAEIAGDDEYVDEEGNYAPVEAKYYFSDTRPRELPYARIHEYPVSRDMFTHWMALNLANTILFSPAEEIDSADITDVQNVYRRLQLSISGGDSVRSIISRHMRSVENWRRFRSPEDNTREMIEIYLGLFDRDADVPRASKACQDLYLTDESRDYKLAYTDYPNDEPQLVLGQYVLNCDDFYDVIAGHPLVIPRVVSVLVDYFFDGRSVEDRTALVESISAADPQTFEDIFSAIVFSRQYLLHTERPKSFEENFFNMSERLRWETHRETFVGMSRGWGSLGRAELAEMGWPSMSLKLGRLAGIPLDSLSFANYHKGLREGLMTDRYRWGVPLGIIKPESPEPEPPEHPGVSAEAEELAEYRAELADYSSIVDAMSPEERGIYDEELALWEEKMGIYRIVREYKPGELVNYLFLIGSQRAPSDGERNTLVQIMENAGYFKLIGDERFIKDWNRDEAAMLVMDYQSRLPENYYLKTR